MKTRIESVKMCLVLTCIVVLFLCSLNVMAAENEYTLGSVRDQSELMVMFSFDVAVVDITFISPSGVEFNQKSNKVDYASGTDWSTYRVNNPENGTWLIRYNQGLNKNVDYSVINVSDGTDFFEEINQNSDQDKELDVLDSNDVNVRLDVFNNSLYVNWSQCTYYSDTGYQVEIRDDDDESLYNEQYERNEQEMEFVFPNEAKSLVVEIKFKSNDGWQRIATKKITINGGEYLNIDEENVTGSAQINLGYSSKEEKAITLICNEEEVEYTISGEGTISMSLLTGANHIRAEFEGKNNIIYCVNREIYYDAYPPEIILYEAINGKNYYTNKILVIGKVKFGDKLWVNGEEIELGEEGEFSAEVKLEMGENEIELLAQDVNGNAVTHELVVYREGAAKEDDKSYWALYVGLTISLLVFVFSLLSIKKKKMEE